MLGDMVEDVGGVRGVGCLRPHGRLIGGPELEDRQPESDPIAGQEHARPVDRLLVHVRAAFGAEVLEHERVARRSDARMSLGDVRVAQSQREPFGPAQLDGAAGDGDLALALVRALHDVQDQVSHDASIPQSRARARPA